MLVISKQRYSFARIKSLGMFYIIFLDKRGKVWQNNAEGTAGFLATILLAAILYLSEISLSRPTSLNTNQKNYFFLVFQLFGKRISISHQEKERQIKDVILLIGFGNFL